MDMVQAVILDLIQGLGEFLSLSALGADHSGGGAGGGSGACRVVQVRFVNPGPMKKAPPF